MASTTQPSRMTTATGMSASTDLMARLAAAAMRCPGPGGDASTVKLTGKFGNRRQVRQDLTLSPAQSGECPATPGRGPALLPAQLPLIVAQQRHHTATALDPVDLDLAAADHEVRVDAGDVDAELAECFSIAPDSAVHADGQSVPERNVAGGVLVEQGRSERNPKPTDARGAIDECDFAEAGCTRVRRDQSADHIVPRAGVHLGDAAGGEAQLQVPDSHRTDDQRS